MKNKVYIALLLIFFVLFGCIIGYKISENNKDSMKIYKIEATTDDSLIILENMRLVSAGNNIYIEPNYLIRKNQNANNIIEGFKLNVTIDNKEAVNLTLTDNLNYRDGFMSDSGILLKDINISDNSVVNVHFNYLVDGKTYDCSQDILLNSEMEIE